MVCGCGYKSQIDHHVEEMNVTPKDKVRRQQYLSFTSSHVHLVKSQEVLLYRRCGAKQKRRISSPLATIRTELQFSERT